MFKFLFENKSYNLLSLGVGEKLQLTIRFYRESWWFFDRFHRKYGVFRRLGPGRYALDLGHISFLCSGNFGAFFRAEQYTILGETWTS